MARGERVVFLSHNKSITAIGPHSVRSELMSNVDKHDAFILTFTGHDGKISITLLIMKYHSVDFRPRELRIEFEES